MCTQRALWLQRALCGLRWQGAAIGGRTAHMPHILRWRGVLLAGRRYLHFLGPGRGNNQVACCAPREVSRFIYGVRERSRRPHTRSALPLTTVCDVKLEVTPERVFSLNKISARIVRSCCGLIVRKEEGKGKYMCLIACVRCVITVSFFKSRQYLTRKHGETRRRSINRPPRCWGRRRRRPGGHRACHRACRPCRHRHRHPASTWPA